MTTKEKSSLYRTVVVVDRHSMVRSALISLLKDIAGIRIIGESGDGLATMHLSRTLRPDLVLMDPNLPSLDGIDAIPAIIRQCPGIAVVVLSEMICERTAARALRAGADAYVLKHSDTHILVDAIHAVGSGPNPFVDPVLDQQSVLKLLRKSWPMEEAGPGSRQLTKRERQVLKQIAEGSRNVDIAAHLCISPKTVESHRLNLMRKLDAHSTADLTRAAFRLRLTTL